MTATSFEEGWFAAILSDVETESRALVCVKRVIVGKIAYQIGVYVDHDNDAYSYAVHAEGSRRISDITQYIPTWISDSVEDALRAGELYVGYALKRANYLALSEKKKIMWLKTATKDAPAVSETGKGDEMIDTTDTTAKTGFRAWCIATELMDVETEARELVCVKQVIANGLSFQIGVYADLDNTYSYATHESGDRRAMDIREYVPDWANASVEDALRAGEIYLHYAMKRSDYTALSERSKIVWLKTPVTHTPVTSRYARTPDGTLNTIDDVRAYALKELMYWRTQATQESANWHTCNAEFHASFQGLAEAHELLLKALSA